MRILTHYLYVPKGEDTRMVYNGTSSGLNNTLWDPHFALPTVASKLIAVEMGTYMADREIVKGRSSNYIGYQV